MGKAKRKIIKIDEGKCTGCGLCVPSCKEGALKVVDGKARLVSDVYCDGLGACIGECPFDALTIEERDADEFDEVKVEAHLRGDVNGGALPDKLPCGCPGTMARTLKKETNDSSSAAGQDVRSELSQWPVKLALIPANAPYLADAELVLLADCTAVAYANLHRDFLRGKAVAIACPKLDEAGPHVEKLSRIMKTHSLRSVEVVMMEVPCCQGLFEIAAKAKEISGGNVRLRKTIIGLEGNILDDRQHNEHRRNV